MATEKELKQIITNNDGGSWYLYFRNEIGTANVYEIWTSTKAGPADFTIPPDHTPQTRFWVEDKKRGSKEYFEYFEQLAAHLNGNYFEELTAHVDDTKSKGPIAPADMTIGQLMGALKPSEFYGALVLVGGCIVGAFWLGVALAPFFAK
jgi:hypothetical protein